MSEALSREFFDRPVLRVAPDLLGRLLVRRYRGRRLAGRIVEVEAYGGLQDAASHARCGPTPRNRVMFGPPGHSYVYQIYGLHCCLNLVCEPQGQAAAVLIRALEPVEGEDVMAALRPGRSRREWTSGPGRLCRALALDRRHDGLELPSPGLWLEAGEPLPRKRQARSPRIGVAYAGEAARWLHRFYERGNPFVSRP